MAKLYFRYGAMNSGKSTALLQAAYNYEERNQRVLLAKPAIDTKGEATIVSRLGVTRPVDFTIGPDEDLYDAFQRHRRGAVPVSCLLLDEVQFLSEQQVDDLLRIAILDDVPVLAYGIRTDFQTVAFPGSRRLLEIAHSLEELKTICRCGRKAVFNARTVDGEFVFDGDQVAIDASSDLSASASSDLSASASSDLSASASSDLSASASSDLSASGARVVGYESLCGACYLDESGGVLNNGWRPRADFSYRTGPDADFT